MHMTAKPQQTEDGFELSINRKIAEFELVEAREKYLEKCYSVYPKVYRPQAAKQNVHFQLLFLFSQIFGQDKKKQDKIVHRLYTFFFV